ncbi:hypothetical protein MKW92_010610 [Papaver armeniacum]|nr:hypothetical protein MKW92_010610 [Papaver armeniacum]
MSWFKDPQWYLENDNGTMKIYRVRENFSSPIAHGDFTDVKVIANYLSLVDHSFSWKRSDFDAFAAFLDKYDIIVNCQGVVLTLTFPRDRALNKPIISRSTRLWSHDVVDLRRYGLHVPTVPFRVVRYLEGGPAPVEPSPKENEFAAKLAACIKERDQERSQRKALEKSVSELKEELERKEEHF